MRNFPGSLPIGTDMLLSRVEDVSAGDFAQPSLLTADGDSMSIDAIRVSRRSEFQSEDAIPKTPAAPRRIAHFSADGCSKRSSRRGIGRSGKGRAADWVGGAAEVSRMRRLRADECVGEREVGGSQGGRGGAQAAAGGSRERRSAARTRSTSSGAVITAVRERRPPHRGQIRRST